MKKVSLLIAVIFILIGCGEIDKKEVSKENFKRVLNDYSSRNCVMVSYGKFPKEMHTEGFMFGGYGDELKRTEALEKLGYLTSEKLKKDNQHDSLKKRFLLTEKGKKIYVDIEKSQGLCAFTRKVKSIDNYTEPSDRMGITMTRVDFTLEPIKPNNIIDDMKKEKVLADFIEEHSKKTSGNAILILTGVKGWIHEKDFKGRR